MRLADFCNPTFQKRAPDVSRDCRVAAGVAPDALAWTLRITPRGPLWPARFFPPRREHSPLATGRVRPSPLTPPSPPELHRHKAGSARTTKTASTGAVRDWHQLDRPEGVFLWQGPLRELFTGTSTGVPPAVSRSRHVPSLAAVLPPRARPRPLTSAATEARFLSQTPLTRFCNLSTRNPSTPTNGSASRGPKLSLFPLPDPTEAEPSCERHGTVTSLSSCHG